MNLQEQIISAINTTLKNPIYQTLQLLNIKSILKSANYNTPRKTNSFLDGVYLGVTLFLRVIIGSLIWKL